MSKANKTRKYIIEKTAVIFNKKGYDGTSLNDLTRATNLTKGSIYGNFKNKEEVAAAAFNYNYQNLIRKFQAELVHHNTAKGKLLAFKKIFIEYMPEIFKNGGCALLNNAVYSDDTNQKLKDLSVKAFNSWRQSLMDIINEGKKNGEFKSYINERYYAELFISMIEGSGIVAKTTGDYSYFTNTMDHFEHMVMHEILK
jgi:AcrR family transcriptional regulator